MSAKKSCFVVSAIGEPGSDERKHADLVLNYIIKKAAKEAGYDVVRGDDVGRSGMITVDVVNCLLDADLVIADLSWHNPNVFYEVGLRHSTGKPTIHIAAQGTRLPFDNADHRAIFYGLDDWHSHQEARRLLKKQIEAAERNDVTNPVTVARAHKNDAHFKRILEAVTQLLDRLEAKLEELTVEPPPGHITRDQHKAVSEQHRKEISDIVASIRLRIATKDRTTEATPVSSIVDSLRSRVDLIEVTLRRFDTNGSGPNGHGPNGHSGNIHPENKTPQ